jgi:trehalose utilization protein
MIRVTVWNEYRHEKEDAQVAAIYPDGIHNAIAKYLNACDGLAAGTATLDEPEHGLTDQVLADTDVLLWWGHIAHGEVRDEVVDKVYERVMRGMGLIVLHSGHHSKIFRKLMGTTCNLSWRDTGERERVWVIEPGHPVCRGLGGSFELEHEEMYGERFDIPEPDALVMLGWFKGGEVIRAGCCYSRGYGKVFYFQPGHEMHPNFYNANVQTVLSNAVRWACPETTAGTLECPHIEVPPEGLG